MILDACFSGRAPDGATLMPGMQPLLAVREQPVEDTRVATLTAAESNQFAGPLPGAERPAFTYLLLGALRGWGDFDGDGRVSLREAGQYARDALQTLLRDRPQTPTFGGEPLGDVSGAAVETGPDLAEMVLAHRYEMPSPADAELAARSARFAGRPAAFASTGFELGSS